MISIIIPCHNYGKYLKQCIESVLKQTYKNYEVIVVNDSSTDNTKKISKSYKEVKYYEVNFKCSQKTRNFGWKKSKGEYLLFLDADNYLKSDYLEKLLKGFISPNIAFTYCKRQFIFEGDCSWFDREEARRWEVKSYDYSELIRSNYIDMCSLINRKYFKGFKEEAHALQDWALWLELAEKGLIGNFIDEELFYYRVHSRNMIRNSKELKNEEEKFIRKYFKKGDGNTTIFITFSGKWFCIDKVLSGIDNILFDRKRINIVCYDNSCDENFSIRLLAWIRDRKIWFNSVKYIRDDSPKSDMTVWNRELSNKLGIIYSKIPELIKTEYTFIIEDDVGVPPYVLKDNLSNLLPNVGAISGRVIDRRNYKPLVWKKIYKNKFSPRLEKKDSGIEEIAGTGMGCLLFKTKLAKRIKYTKKYPQDVDFCRQIKKQGYKVLINWGVHCKHYDQKVVAIQ